MKWSASYHNRISGKTTCVAEVVATCVQSYAWWCKTRGPGSVFKAALQSSHQIPSLSSVVKSRAVLDKR